MFHGRNTAVSLIWLGLEGEGSGNPLQCSCLENPREGEPGGLPSMGSHRVRHDWSDLAAAAAVHTSKVMLKILQARLQLDMNCEIPDVQAGFRKGRGIRDLIANICWIIEKAREFQKNISSALLTVPKPLTVWVRTSCGKFLKRWEYQTTWPASWEICMQVKKQQLELDMEQQTGSKSEKESVKAALI